jgi:O-antigen/teichoic acid export membrane protein
MVPSPAPDNARILSEQDPASRESKSAEADPTAAEAIRGATPPESSAEGGRSARQIGERAIANTVYRSAGEVVGRLASLVLFAEAGRTLGQSGLGAFVFAVAYTGVVIVPVGLGLDRYILYAIARERASRHRLFFNVLVLKLALAIPLFGLGFLVLHLIGYDGKAQATAWVLAPGAFADSVARTQLSVFAAHERNGPPATADAINRILSAALGIAALKLGYGVVAVGASYSIGSMCGVALGFFFMARTVGMPARAITVQRWRRMVTTSIPFASQDVLGMLLAKADTLILALIATQAAVGRYGAAYRLFESTAVISYAVIGAFAAMFAYLGHDTTPTVRSVFERSIKLAMVLLMPLAVAFVVLAGPISSLIYGAGLASSSSPLRILGPGVVLMGVITLTISLLVSRGNPRQAASVTGAIVAINIALNLILIPAYGVTGAAAAMLGTEVIYLAWTMRLAARAVGGISWLHVTAGALVGGIFMAAVALPLHSSLPAALIAGGAAYIVAVLATERLVSPEDLAFMTDMVRRRMPTRLLARGPIS